MNYTETLSWIHGTERFGSRLGLGRMGRLLHRMGDPHLKVPFIHVAGTNGKGSTTTLIASALTAGGFKTGKFISPYILEFRERMQIDGQMIPEETLAELATRLRPIAEEFKAAGDPVTEFELRRTKLRYRRAGGGTGRPFGRHQYHPAARGRRHHPHRL